MSYLKDIKEINNNMKRKITTIKNKRLVEGGG